MVLPCRGGPLSSTGRWQNSFPGHCCRSAVWPAESFLQLPTTDRRRQMRLARSEPPTTLSHRTSLVCGYLSRNDSVDDAPSPVANATNDRGIGTGLSPVGARQDHHPVRLASPPGGEAGPVSFRGRVRGIPISQLNRSGLGNSAARRERSATHIASATLRLQHLFAPDSWRRLRRHRVLVTRVS